MKSFASQMIRPLACVTAMVAALTVSPLAFAHGGDEHDHHDTPARAPAAAIASAAPQRLPDGSVRVPKAAQQHMGLRTVQATRQMLHRAITLQARVLADPNAGGRVQASQAGRIEAGPQGLPMPGQRVGKGQVLAYLHPIATSVEHGNQRAAMAELQAQLAIAERKLTRYAQLEGAIAQKDVDAARIERDGLAQRLSALRGGIGAPQALVAPASGVLSASHVALGQVVDAREALFDIVDPRRLMVEALLYEPALIDRLGDAAIATPDGPLALRLIGSSRQLRELALPVLFRVIPPRLDAPVPLAVGQSLSITVQTTQSGEGIALPRGALQRQPSGETIVWLQDGPEHFTPRRVTAVPLDARQMAITQGLKPQERVVTEGASLLAQVR